jgi:hypothetical protein
LQARATRGTGAIKKDAVPKTFVDWCTVIALALAVWAVSSKPRTALKRWTLNWWATRSRANTEKRIQKLQTELAKAESLPLLTEFEAIVLRGLSVIFLFACIIPLLMFLAYAMIYTNVPILPVPATLKEFLNEVQVTLFATLLFLLGFGMSREFENFRLLRSTKYRDTVRKNIEELQARLK